ncbi:hypothetical protein [Thalassobellus citreus]|uniref:hypothetical protein n=1 Tax=Thalassobellus citreus TaxID=3367752 RepID=UPI00378ACD2E
MKLFLEILLLVLVLSCNQKKKELKVKEQTTEKQVDTLGVYNDVLNDLIENYLYNNYLGEKAQLLVVDWFNKKIDETTYINKINVLKNKVITEDSLKGVLYIDGVFDGYTTNLESLNFVENNNFYLEEVVVQISKENLYAVDSLKSNFVKIKRFRNSDEKKEFEVGDISFSKIVFNKNKDSAILYFSFVCGGKCGEGSLVLIKIIDGKWKVEKKYSLWEI